MIQHFDEKSFDESVLNAKGLVLVDFWATWCGPCLMLSPIIESLADEMDGQIVIGKVNVDEESELASKYQVLSIPTLILFQDGEEIDRTTGFSSKEKIIEFVQKHQAAV
ncbi:thioredoxin [Candidatus Soleaferrea massiliensis]|uniref:thioredoxin n=1 Tax=Candidatus Soleaferrea massiliensis TaxID=1470354 RepID=UPI0006941259|nr:thioredoxin [Candidatus Soleaferrea massiliensis]